MRACFAFICFLAATCALPAMSKHHGKHRGLHKPSHTMEEKVIITEDVNNSQVSHTLVPVEIMGQEKKEEEMSSESNKGAKKIKSRAKIRKEKSSAALLSEEELVDLLKKDAEEDEKVEVKNAKDEEVQTSNNLENGTSGAEQRKLNESAEGQVKEEKMGDGMDNEKEILKEKAKNLPDEMGKGAEEAVFSEEAESSTDSDVLPGIDNAEGGGIDQPLQMQSTKVIIPADNKQLGTEDEPSDLKKVEDIDYQQDVQTNEEEKDHGTVMSDNFEATGTNKKELESTLTSGKEKEDDKNEDKVHSEVKTKKQKRNQRSKKDSSQRARKRSDAAQGQQAPEGQDTSSLISKPKRRRTGKWGLLVGVNPVQIRATVNLHPSSKSSTGGLQVEETPADPCYNFRCKRGKTCKLDNDNKPQCVCQEPSECPVSVNEFDHVCGTDNKTYDTSCMLFATKCNLEGTKTGHRLHLDYSGPCKLILPCLETELLQFPLRMRDWLKNVLLQLFELDSMSPGYLTPKQRFRVKKIFENEQRLHAGNHSVELLAQDFEKNYIMYIYPVHWQFAQLDQHPSDRLLTHSELAPLRVPLVPMEHCISTFFQKCDADKDKQISFNEWTSCFGIKVDDVDPNLLF